MVIGTVTGAFGAAYFTDDLGLGVPWGPTSALLFGMLCGTAVRVGARARDDHVPGGPHRVGRGDQPRSDRAGPLPVVRLLRPGDPVRSGRPHLTLLDLPLLSSLPAGLGRAFQDLSPMVLVAALAVVPATFVLNRTRWGLRLRSAGENPEATRSLGVRVAPLRWRRGADLGCARGSGGGIPFRRGRQQLARRSDARPWLHRARRPHLVELEPCQVDRGGVPLRIRSSDPAAPRGPSWIIELLPPQIIRMTPFVVTIVVLAGFVGKVRPPAAAGRAYEGSGGI